MGYWHLVVLGKPAVSYGDQRIEHLPKRSLWGVLASLALDPVAPTRTILAERFWPEVENPAQSLRSGLSTLRKVFSPELVTSELRLVQGTTCDLLEFESLYRQAKTLTSTPERRPLLEEAALLLNGHFLDGCETGEVFDWIQQMRAVVLTEGVELLEMLLDCQREQGDKEAAFDTIQRILSLDPDNPRARQELLASSVPVMQRLSVRMGWVEAEQLLVETATLAFEDKVTLDSLLKEQLGKLPTLLHPALFSLSIFSADFTLEQATEISGAVASDLTLFVERGFLHTDDGGRKYTDDGGRYRLLKPVQESLWRKLTGEQRRRLRERHAQWFASWSVELRDPRIYREMLPTLEVEAQHLKVALLWILKQTPTKQGVKFIRRLWESLPAFHETLNGAYSYLEQFIEIPDADIEVKRVASVFLVYISQTKGQYEDANVWIDRCENLCRDSKEHFEWMCQHLLIMYHNNGDDESFDIILSRVNSHFYDGLNVNIPVHLCYNIAENFLARKRFIEALPHNESFVVFSKTQGNVQNRGAALMQRGIILNGLNRREEARFSWNEALAYFEEGDNPHGMGQCLEALANLYLEAGALSEARRAVMHAMEHYKESGDEAAVYAAKAPLGDVLRERGDINQARCAYEEGLTFWQARQHPRWIAKFEARLDELSRLGELKEPLGTMAP